MKKILIFMLILLSIPIASAQLQDDFNDVSFVDMNFKINGGISLNKNTANGNINEIYVDLTFFPREELNQEVIKLKASSSPFARVTEKADGIEYYWTNPENSIFKFDLNSDVKVRNSLVVVDEKITFPLEGQDTFYTRPTEFIDINEDIKKQAQTIANGESDLYVVTFKVAKWIQENVKYDLSTLTADVVQKSSWVLSNKEGVCDEITNLFISMMRSLGVPARYVSGMAYTNTKEEWGAHAWAEVYFPGKGWVPFDVTYGQLGWLDPTHLKIKTSVDSGESAVRYSWKSMESNFRADKLNVSTVIISKGSKIGKQLYIRVKPLINNVGPGSYVPIEVEIENRNNNYFPTLIIVRKAPELIESNYRPVLLKPLETKREFWIVKIPSDLDKNYVYYSIIDVEDNFHYNATSELSYFDNGKIVTLDEAKKIIDSKTIKEEKKISYGVSIDCESPEAIYYYEDLNIKCNIKNRGNTFLVDTNVCIEDECKYLYGFGIAEQKDVEFTKNNLANGTNNIIVTVKNKDLERYLEASDIISVDVVDNPELEITGVYYNATPKYNQDMRLEIALNLKLPVNNVRIYINNAQVLTADKLDRAKGFTIFSKGKYFAGSRDLEMMIKFKDLNGKDYVEKKIYTIEVLDVPWYVKFLGFLELW